MAERFLELATHSESHKSISRGSAPNQGTAMTHYLCDCLLHRREGATASKLVQRCKPPEYRVWLKYMEGIYPVQTHLHWINKAPMSNCPHCSERVGETLTHFPRAAPSFETHENQ
jgi:hypothetical protein